MNIRSQHAQLLAEIELEARQTAALTGRPAFSTGVMDALASVPRHKFVPEAEEALAYVNGPLPIGHRQTISQPYIVALMTDLLEVDENSTVLEIGTGSGYQTAILAELAQQVYSIEIIDELAQKAGTLLQQLGYTNIKVKSGDGYHGWREFVLIHSGDHEPILHSDSQSCAMALSYTRIFGGTSGVRVFCIQMPSWPRP